MEKSKLKELFQKNWKEHYALEFFKEKGFVRKQCKNCKEFFWTLDGDREFCADAKCVGLNFIGKKRRTIGYIETWKEVEKYFNKNGHATIARYPVVCRWRDDLYFTNASIIDFQPYVVSGAIKPPANPLIIAQPCLRFADIANVGFTGAHYTAFIMIGQHAFNKIEEGTFYWKDEAIEHDFNVVTKILKAKDEDVVFHEDVWLGGGSLGPCIEYFVEGIELGNCVFMQFKETPTGIKELPMRVIDMGAGLERFAWFANGTINSYEIVFGNVIRQMKKDVGFKEDKELMFKFSKYANLLNADEFDLKKSWKLISQKLGIEEKELLEKIYPLQALYAIADHLKAFLYAYNDGMLPSNSGGGYNIRIILRKSFAENIKFNFNLDFAKIIELHAKELKNLDDTLQEGIEIAKDVLDVEYKKFISTKENARTKLKAIIEQCKKENKKITKEEQITLYESYGIPIELIKEEAAKNKIEAEEIYDIYKLLARKNIIEKEEEKLEIDTSKIKKTRKLFYEDVNINEFDAKVLAIIDSAIILDKTAFYPESGGQAADLGVINGIKVLDVQEHDGVILHYVEKPEAFKVGQKISAIVDLNRRKILMQHHTAAHLLNAAARHLLGKHIWQAGSYKNIDKAHLDITHYKRITDEELKKIELAVNKAIQQNLPVEIEILPRDEAEKKFGFRIYQGGYVPGKEIRIVNIKGYEVEACGGLHVANTGQIGFFKILKRESIKDGVERITFVAGIPAILHVQEQEQKLKKISEILKTPIAQLEKTSLKIMEELKLLRKKLEKSKESSAERIAEELVKGMKKNKIIGFLKEKDKMQLIKIAEFIIKKEKNSLVILANENGDIISLTSQVSKFNAKDELEKILKECKGRGGGNKKLAQGKISEIEKFVKLSKKF